jgi:hypothetical protein
MQDCVVQIERLLRQGEPLLAYDLVREGLQRWPGQLRLRQLAALALARSGDLERANRLLGALAASGADDPETLGVLARTHKGLALAASDAAGRRSHLEAASGIYLRAYRAALGRGALDGAGYTGINAATVAVLQGDLARARDLAAEVRTICLQSGGGLRDEYWRFATLGEAALILGEQAEATECYAHARSLAGDRYGDLGTTRRQARLLAASLPEVGDAVIDALAAPPVLVFTGHMVDRAGREPPRFPPQLEPALREALRGPLAARPPLAAYGSAACGADILCHELVLELGGEVHVVLPFPAAEFRQTSVEIGHGDWGARFDRLLSAAHSVTVASDHRASGSDASFEYANLVLTGLGRLRAQGLGTELRGLAVWDPGGGGARGGVASVVSVWQRGRVPFDHVNPSQLRAPVGAPAAAKGPATPPPVPASAGIPEAEPVVPHYEIKSMLFADAVGCGELAEDQIPAYVTGFLGSVAALNRRTQHRFEHVETAGDTLYMVFDSAGDAALYALELNELVNSASWADVGLPPGFSLRIVLHCGPVYCCTDPVTGSAMYAGPHASRAARIEPIAPPGQVYASAAFAAVAAASAADGFRLRYVGSIPLEGRSGSMPLYHLQRDA